jgi:hypothetical protein
LLAVDAHGREAALAALVLGDGAGLARQDWQALQATGTVHLLVISGRHIGLLAGLVYGAVAGWPAWAAGRDACLGCPGPAPGHGGGCCTAGWRVLACYSVPA